jgi:23S rRNA (uracil1939-C5)-methyltransferase
MSTTRIRIRALAHGGDGIGNLADGDGPTWFVPGALPQEEIEAEEVRAAKRFTQGRLVQIVEPSPHRVEPPCQYAASCGGCQWQHVAPIKQPEFKARIVADQLRGLNTGVRVGFAGPESGYRRRARLHYRRAESGFALGFHAPRSREVVDVGQCAVLDPALDAAAQKLRSVAGLLPASGEVLGLSDGTKVVLGLPRVKPSPEVLEGLRAVLDDTLVGIEVRGGRQRGHVGQRLLEVDGTPRWPAVRLGAFSFGQANAPGNRALVEHVATQAEADGLRVLELYAGAGNFTRALARTAQRVWASDTDHDAIKTLQGLAKAEDLPINAKRQSATNLLPKLAESRSTYEVIVLDPPRAGLGKEGMAAACRVATERIVYVSCDPATLARDLEVATQRGFDIDDITVFDLMPMTSHVEVVATLRSRSAG